jgi:hypothetical protein
MYEFLSRAAGWIGLSVCVFLVGLFLAHSFTACTARSNCHDMGVKEVGLLSVTCNPPASNQ